MQVHFLCPLHEYPQEEGFRGGLTGGPRPRFRRTVLHLRAGTGWPSVSCKHPDLEVPYALRHYLGRAAASFRGHRCTASRAEAQARATRARLPLRELWDT